MLETSVIRFCLLPLLLVLFSTGSAASACPQSTSDWTQWQAFSRHFIQSDGRVVERSQKSRTTSEGQAYSLFHALVANDRDTFRKVLEWTNNNLAVGNLESQLPAWTWGQKESGEWGVLDQNTASDADMWLAYTLIEAGRLWNSPRYRLIGESMLRNIEAFEVEILPNLGAMVLPGKKGFQLTETSWRLNPSYLPIQLLRRFSSISDNETWDDVIDSTVKLLLASGSSGIVPDWVVYNKSGKFSSAGAGSVGSYDAIRVYLWLGMLNQSDPLKYQLINQLNFTDDSYGLPPEKIDTRTRIGSGRSPVGFKAAMAPFFKSKGAAKNLHRSIRIIDDQWQHGLLTDNPVYYDQSLALFSLAWLEKRFEFDPEGKLRTRWEKSCIGTAGKSYSS